MHPDRRREGRRIRKQQRLIMEGLPAAVADAVNKLDVGELIFVFITNLLEIQQAVEIHLADLTRYFAQVIMNARCPDCRDGKHGACIGRSWSDELDAEVDCPCALAGHPEDLAQTASIASQFVTP